MGGLDPTVSGVLYTAGGGFVLAVGTAVAKTFGKHRQDARDAQGLREFFFDTPGNPRTGVPPKTGWTSKVDAAISEMRASQGTIERKLDDVLGEVKPDGNGGHNLRGAVDRAARKAEE